MASYSETFTGQSTGSNSTSFTDRYATETDVSIENPAVGEEDDRVLQFGSGETDWVLQTFDDVDADADRAECDIVARFMVTTDQDNRWHLAARASGADGTENLYWFTVDSGSNFSIAKWIAGSYDELAQTADTDDVGPWYEWLGNTFTEQPPNIWLWARFRVSGTNPVTLQAKVWVDGQPEPADWTMDVDDADGNRIQGAGWVGFGSSQGSPSGETYLDYYAVGTDGDVAPIDAGDSPVRVTTGALQTLAQNNATPIRITAAGLQVLYNPKAPRTGQTVVATIFTGNAGDSG